VDVDLTETANYLISQTLSFIPLIYILI